MLSSEVASSCGINMCLMVSYDMVVGKLVSNGDKLGGELQYVE